MGQQQLLLVILVTIIVGIATVVAINVFGNSAASANEDAVRQDILSIAASAQGWYIKPQMMDGGGNSFENMTFRDISFPAEKINTNGDVAENMNGTYVFDAAGTTDGMHINAYPSSADGYSSTINSTDQPSAQTGVADADILSGTIEPDNFAWDT